MNPVSEQAREDVPGSVPVADTSYRGRKLLPTATVLALRLPISSFLLFKRRTAEEEKFGPEVAICRYPWQLRQVNKRVGELRISHLNFDDFLACSICLLCAHLDAVNDAVKLSRKQHWYPWILHESATMGPKA